MTKSRNSDGTAKHAKCRERGEAGESTEYTEGHGRRESRNVLAKRQCAKARR